MSPYTIPTMDTMPLMPLREVVMFPRSIVPLFVGREASIKAIESAMENYDRQILLVAQKDSTLSRPTREEMFDVGTVSRVLQLLRLPDGTIKVLFEGLYRAVWDLEDAVVPEAEGAFQMAVVRPMPMEESPAYEAQATVRAVREAVEEYAKINKKLTADVLQTITANNTPGRLADAIVPHLKVDYLKKQEVLEAANTANRLELVYELLSGEISISSMEKSGSSAVTGEIIVR